MSKDTKPDAWMPLYIGDWDGDTGHLDCEQDGAYGRLIRWYWRNGPLPDDDAALVRIMRMPLARWRKIRPIIAAFFQIADGVWRHKRQDEERDKWAKKRQGYIERSAAGGRAKAAKSTNLALPKSCPSASSREVDAHKGQSTLSGRATAEARLDGASALRVIDGGLSEREAWAAALVRAEADLAHFTPTDPDFASEIAEFVDVARQALADLEAAA